MRKPQSQKVSQSWTKITWFSAKFEFRFESFKSKFTLILSVSKLMIGCSKNNRENYPRKCFWTKEKETRVKFNPRSSANQLSNNWALVHLLVLPMLFIAVNSPNLVHQHWKDQKTAKCPKPLGYCFIWPFKHRSLNCLISDIACISIPTFMAQYFLLPLFLKVYISRKECQSSSPFGEKVNLHTLETIYTSTPILYLKPVGWETFLCWTKD